MGVPMQAVQRLVQEYDEQFTLYTHMLDAARQVQLLCQDGDFRQTESITALNTFLETRQNQMQNIEESQSKTAQCFEAVKIHMGLEEVDGRTLAEVYPSEETRRLKELINTLEPLLQEIVDLDGISQKHLHQKLGGLKEEALRLRKDRDASQLYKQPGAQQSGIFMDGKKF